MRHRRKAFPVSIQHVPTTWIAASCAKFSVVLLLSTLWHGWPMMTEKSILWSNIRTRTHKDTLCCIIGKTILEREQAPIYWARLKQRNSDGNSKRPQRSRVCRHQHWQKVLLVKYDKRMLHRSILLVPTFMDYRMVAMIAHACSCTFCIVSDLGEWEHCH